MLTVRERVASDEGAVAALLAATADRVAALDPSVRLDRRPGPGPALVAVSSSGTVHGHVRPVVHELAEDDGARMHSPDRSAAWTGTAVDGPEAAAALAAAIRATPAGAEADGLLWPAADDLAAGWWLSIGLERAGDYCLRPPGPLPGPVPDGLTVRTAGPGDVEQVVALHREAVAFQAAASPYVRLLPAGQAGFRTRLLDGRSTSTVLDVGGRLVGVCEWWLEDGDAGPELPAGRYAYLNSVAITADARSGGLGRALVAAALAAAGPDLAGSTLWFSPQNPIARRVWPHLGWRPVWSAWERRS